MSLRHRSPSPPDPFPADAATPPASRGCGFSADAFVESRRRLHAAANRFAANRAVANRAAAGRATVMADRGTWISADRSRPASSAPACHGRRHAASRCWLSLLAPRDTCSASSTICSLTGHLESGMTAGTETRFTHASALSDTARDRVPRFAGTAWIAKVEQLPALRRSFDCPVVVRRDCRAPHAPTPRAAPEPLPRMARQAAVRPEHPSRCTPVNADQQCRPRGEKR